MAHAMGMTALAEGVETTAQSNILLHHGCDVIQGYLYSKPQAFDDIVAALKNDSPLPVPAAANAH
jgi:EAL domain-containing protein (putative c-di-GMP-specific phosphodiesterase class I)